MSQSVFKLESLLETHEKPLMIVGGDLTVVAVNRAWKQVFGMNRDARIGQPCCEDSGACRHKRLFETLEPYACHVAGDKPASVRGYPLLDADGRLFLGETQTLIHSAASSNTRQTLVGKSEVFEGLKAKLQQAAVTQAPVLLLGETGTGKELAAEFVHGHSHQAGGEFVVADCTVFGEDLFESELFGHEKGAFTGATTNKKGLFEVADNGTLFLDEIGELPLSQQAKLLRALESGQFRRVGGTAILRATVRVVCATHRNLADMVRRGQFREDLFYRLSVFPIDLPPLRARRQDIPLLTEHFLHLFGGMRGCQYAIDKAALIKLMQHAWPGNIRELKNCLQLATGLCQNRAIREGDIQFMRMAHDLPPPYPAQVDSPPVEYLPDQTMVGMTAMEQYEASFIAKLIAKYQGNRKLIAAEMNISERTLYRKLNRLNLS
ncbi:MAG: sigma 54-interacting transcriptional regulator [Methylomonas sp.]|nr:sigma 54-interacting transcriptional regulator [Methylomonas sp.]PPD21073.1 MAG: Fis family transcriptional regulator [Methylomonas sp.]PPD25311.1 MAG: Fis family transcriptional regulator [Methylomonas sp.]PPD35289.1 MAG: Fis family transcriptional regulator [Methylomonas sp.]PPD38504.1 MAG: Fis family transcriptional regulator [Methylomonas sp.]